MANPVDLEGLWRYAMAEHHPYWKLAKKPGKASGQMLHFVEAVGSARAGRIVLCVSKDWPGFAVFAKRKCGAYGLPEVPNVGFLIRNAEAAINF